MKLYWEDLVSIFKVAIIIALLIGMGIFAVWGFPALMQNKADRDFAHAVISDINYSFNDSVSMVKYNYGFFGGLSGVDSTTVTLLHGTNQTLGVIVNPYTNETTAGWWDPLSTGQNGMQVTPYNQTLNEFTFSGNLDVHSGNYCKITYAVVTHRDNATEVNPISIQVLP
jgi:hypothetical protein